MLDRVRMHFASPLANTRKLTNAAAIIFRILYKIPGAVAKMYCFGGKRDLMPQEFPPFLSVLCNASPFGLGYHLPALEILDIIMSFC